MLIISTIDASTASDVSTIIAAIDDLRDNLNEKISNTSDNLKAYTDVSVTALKEYTDTLVQNTSVTLQESYETADATLKSELLDTIHNETGLLLDDYTEKID